MNNRVTDFFWTKKYIILFFVLFIVVLTQRFLNPRQKGLEETVWSDGICYYAYLPATIIYQDLSYSFYNNKENGIKPCYNIKPQLNVDENNKVFNKYYCGTSICLLPFFLTGVIISKLVGTDMNGYTDVFLMLVSLAAIFYYTLSVFFTTKIAVFLSIPEKVAFFTSLIFFLGTNLFYYVIQEPSMSHVYSFFAVTLFFYLLVRVISNPGKGNIILMVSCLALIILLRPTNLMLILFIPFFFKNFRGFFDFVKLLFTKHLLSISLSLLVFTALISIQCMLYHFQTGHFFIFSYKGETFDFYKPEIFNILFSYRKGLFLYTPLFLAALIFIIVISGSLYNKVVFALIFSVFIYITSSWWCWWYGGGYSNRPFVDIIPLFIIATMYFYNQIHIKKRKWVIVLCVPFLFQNQLMAYQYSNLLMNKAAMTKTLYWDIFLKPTLAMINRDKIKSISSKGITLKTEIKEFNDLIGSKNIVSEGYNSKASNVIGKDNNFSEGFAFNIAEQNLNESFYVVAECNAKANTNDNDLKLVISIYNENGCTGWAEVIYNQFSKNEANWAYMTNVFRIDKQELNKNTVVKVFAFSEKGHNLVDDIKYTLIKE